MDQKQLHELTNEELLQEAKKRKSAATTDALIIGFLFGVICYSVVKNSWGWLTLILLYFIYKLMTKPKYNKQELEQLLRERNLK